MIKPKKLIRHKTINFLRQDEFEIITDKDELNKLYAMKIQEELLEIQKSKHVDIMEFVDLITVAVCWAKQNGHPLEYLVNGLRGKLDHKGEFTDIALTNLNPDNPSNEIYFVASGLNTQDK